MHSKLLQYIFNAMNFSRLTAKNFVVAREGGLLHSTENWVVDPGLTRDAIPQPLKRVIAILMFCCHHEGGEPCKTNKYCVREAIPEKKKKQARWAPKNSLTIWIMTGDFFISLAQLINFNPESVRSKKSQCCHKRHF